MESELVKDSKNGRRNYDSYRTNGAKNLERSYRLHFRHLERRLKLMAESNVFIYSILVTFGSVFKTSVNLGFDIKFLKTIIEILITFVRYI